MPKCQGRFIQIPIETRLLTYAARMSKLTIAFCIFRWGTPLRLFDGRETGGEEKNEWAKSARALRVTAVGGGGKTENKTSHWKSHGGGGEGKTCRKRRGTGMREDRRFLGSAARYANVGQTRGETGRGEGKVTPRNRRYGYTARPGENVKGGGGRPESTFRPGQRPQCSRSLALSRSFPLPSAPPRREPLPRGSRTAALPGKRPGFLGPGSSASSRKPRSSLLVMKGTSLPGRVV